MNNKSGKQIRAGAQVITWGDHVRGQLPQILTFLHKCGYTCVEIGMRHFDLSQPNWYCDMMRQSRMELVAVHSGGTFWNQAQADAEMVNIGNAIQFAGAVGCHFFVLSGNKQETPDTMKITASAYNRIGALCHEHGLQLAYHNHNWEFAGDGALFRTLLENTDPLLVQLVPDVAWMHYAGCNPAALIWSHQDRLAYIHLKDIHEGAFCELGYGEVNLQEVLALLPQLNAEWLVVEQDITQKTPEESLSINAEYLRTMGVIK